MSEGAASSYLGTCLSGFPNFFMMMGPNTLSGHLSVIYTTECQINFAMRVIKPIMGALKTGRSFFPITRTAYDIVDVKATAEKKDVDTVQEKAKKLVWASGCTSWFIETKSNRNTSMFPDYQYKFWLRSVFISWGDFNCRTSKTLADARGSGGFSNGLVLTTAATAFVGLGAFCLRDFKF